MKTVMKKRVIARLEWRLSSGFLGCLLLIEAIFLLRWTRDEMVVD